MRAKWMHFFRPQTSNNHRARLLHPEILLYIILAVLGIFALFRAWVFFPDLDNTILGFASDITTNQVILQTNQQRKQYGLSELTYNEQLSQAALAKGQDMFADQYWAHVSPSGKQPWDFIKAAQYQYKVAGENLARDFSHTDEMMAAWMASPTHKANIVNPKFEEIGIAVIDGKLKGFETTLVVQMFGTGTTQTAQIDQEATNQIAESAETLETTTINEEENTDLGKLDVRADEEFVLSESVTGVSERPQLILLSPIQITKVFFLIIILLIVSTLIYDGIVAGHRKIERVVGRNFAHILLFGVVSFLLLLFKGGVV